MTVEATIQRMFDRYPVLFSTREECFNQLFCVVGNGYKWKWGQLVYRGDGSDYDEEAEKARNEADYSRPHVRAKPSDEYVEARKRRTLSRLRPWAADDKGVLRRWYPLSRKYSKLFTVPADAREDWKAAVEECKRMLEKDGVDWQGAE